MRVKCPRCGAHATEKVPWAELKQRQTTRLQHHLALDAYSMPLSHVATKYALSWRTVRRAEADALARWERSRPPRTLRQVGVDEKWLGRRHKRTDKFVTIVSDLESGEPVWIGYGRGEATLAKWLTSLSPEQKAAIVLFATDMHAPFAAAIRADAALAHAPVVHDPFHVTKRAGEAITELRRSIFFRASLELREVGRGTRWLVLRAWDRTSDSDKRRLRRLFSFNGKLARAYQVVEELREVLKAPDKDSMETGLRHVLYRTEKRTNVPMRKLHVLAQKPLRLPSSLSANIIRPPVASKRSTATGRRSSVAAEAIETMITYYANFDSSLRTPFVTAKASCASSRSACRRPLRTRHEPLDASCTRRLAARPRFGRTANLPPADGHLG